MSLKTQFEVKHMRNIITSIPKCPGEADSNAYQVTQSGPKGGNDPVTLKNGNGTTMFFQTRKEAIAFLDKHPDIKVHSKPAPRGMNW